MQIGLQNSSDLFGTSQVTGPQGAWHFDKKNRRLLKTKQNMTILIIQVVVLVIDHQDKISGSLDSLGINFLLLFSRKSKTHICLHGRDLLQEHYQGPNHLVRHQEVGRKSSDLKKMFG